MEPSSSVAEADTGPTPSTPARGWTRRLSQSSISRPTLPSIGGLRAALLGYIGEVERTVRDRVGGEEGENVSVAGFSSPSLSTSDEDGVQGLSSSIAGPSSLRNRVDGQGTDYFDFGRNSGSPSRMANAQNRLLEHLSSLREDVTRYLPHRLPVPSSSNLGVHGEWLRNLPNRLRLVDLSVTPALPPDSQPPGSPVVDHISVEHARRKVIELAKALLPSEEWAGWERLGWEEQDPEVSSRRHSVDLGVALPEEDEPEEEPEYLFPNRTPASAQAFASRRRAVRSKSLGSANFPTIKKTASMPRLNRTRTEPYLGKNGVYLGDDDDEDEDLDATEVYVFDDEKDILQLGRVSSATALGPSVAEALKLSEDGKKLIEYEGLPFLWRNNEHILTGYRFMPLHASTGPIPLIKSAFKWHNETVNIHSHFLPTIMILLFIPTIIYTSPLPDAHPLDTASLVVYLLAAVSCLVSSAGWHVLAGCASHKWFEWGACVDYVGISWLIAASFFTVLYNAFYCQPKIVLIYSSVNLVCGALGSYLPFQKWFNERRNKNWRISFFLFLCSAMFAPMVHLYFKQGWERFVIFTCTFWPSVGSYVVGLLFYAFHFPECTWPGKFDYWGMSHNLWHVAIVGAIILHYRGIFTAHSMRYDYSCALSDAQAPVGEIVEKGWWSLMRSLGFGGEVLA